MLEAPPGLKILETRDEGPVRVVYGAEQVPLGRIVLLVGLAPGVLSSSPLARGLEHEAEVLSKLDHPNILKLYDLKRDQSQLWLVLEDVSGPKLSELTSRNISWQAAAAITLDLCRALAHAHSLNEIHGKLHPDAVQLTKSGRTKVFGFGQRPRPEDNQAEALEPHGSGGLSPEASVGQSIGPLSDLFSVGALLYELLTGTAPFGDPSEAQYASRVRHDRPRPLLGARPDVPAALESLVGECLEKLPSKRPPSAQYLADRLEELIGGATLPILRSSLGEMGYLDGQTPGEQERAPEFPLAQPRSRRVSALVLGGIALSALIGALVTSAFFLLSDEPSAGAVTTPTKRDLPVEQAVLLRVVASPWAHVVVDGEHRATTPFAQPIVLSPGKHVVRLEHPHAPPEERVINGQAGQGIFLNVQLHVEKPLTLEPVSEIPVEESP